MPAKPMDVSISLPEDLPSSPESESNTISLSEPCTPLSNSGQTPLTCLNPESLEDNLGAVQKKKKKKKSKKSAKAKEATKSKAQEGLASESRPPVLCISRNKHWRYISSYHGPWLQLPVELLDSLLTINLDPHALSNSEPRHPSLLPPPSTGVSKLRDRGFHGLSDSSPPESPRNMFSALPLAPPFPPPVPGKATPPPIDPGVFRSVRLIRKLIDEAAELSVRASSGLSAVELGSMRGGQALGGNPWATVQSLGINPLGNNNTGGRNVAMSAMRIHRLRALAVQKLAQAYKADEIASSVMVMQGGSVFDDVAERVLKVDSNDPDAKYVHFFHEKIPSRQLAESTSTKVLDELIAAYPQRLEYYRTRGTVHCFREEYAQATRDFTYALKEARTIRKARMMHHGVSVQGDSRTSKGKRRKGSSANHVNGRAPPSGTSAMDSRHDNAEPEPVLKHPSITDDAPDPIEPQLLFLRGAAYLQHAIHLIETAVLQLERVCKQQFLDGAELRLCYIENGKYGGVEINHPDGPLGKADGPKRLAYTQVLGDPQFRNQIALLVKKSQRDHEKFLSHFDTLDSLLARPEGDLAYQVEYAFQLSESSRPGNHSSTLPNVPDAPAIFTTYHPLLVESHYSILICQLMLADFSTLLPAFVHAACIVDGLEGYPIFLPPRSMAQAEFVEVLERLASGWKNGIQPHSLSTQRGKSRRAIEGPPVIRSPFSVSRTNSQSEYEDENGAGSSSITDDGQGTGASASSSSQLVPHMEEATASRLDAQEALDYARILLAPVAKRQRERAERAAAEKAARNGKKKPGPINIPLHGPRVEVILAWFGAVHVPELNGA